MREILFRGIRKDSDCWEVGDYSTYTTSDGISHSFINGFEYEVYPETVGQYTGLKDKYGNKIFEGDIIMFISEKRGKKYTIGFDEEDCSFSIFLDGIVYYQLQKSECHDIKVIGNIYENTELLGE